MRVMVVDDDADICFTVDAIGTYAGWIVHACRNVESALSALGVFNPDILILDYHLPLICGLAALPLLRQRNPRLPIIMLTVEDDGKLAERCREAGANDFSLKPVKALDLIYRVNINLEASKLRQHTYSSSVEPLEKGLNQETVDLILDFSRKQGEYFTITEASRSLQLGYSTTHRYLSYLEDQKYLKVQHGYGKQGRPRKKYMISKREGD